MADQAPTAPAGIPAVGATDDEKMKGAIAYVFSTLTGIIILIMAGDNKFLKFHAWQSIVSGIVIWIVYFIIATILGMLLVGICLDPLLAIAIWIYYLYGAYTVYQGKPFRMPFFADLVEKNLMK